MLILDLGCGDSKLKGSTGDTVVGMDVCDIEGVDIIADAEQGIPLSASVFDMVFCDQFLEHVSDLCFVMKEIHRVLKPDGILKIISPHAPHCGAFSNIQHKHFFTYYSFDAFDLLNKRHNMYAEGTDFVYKTRKLKFILPWRAIGLQWLFNKMPYIYENVFSGIFQAGLLEIELQCVKEELGCCQVCGRAANVFYHWDEMCIDCYNAWYEGYRKAWSRRA
jgi:SAM-dependent methyltransferase